MRTVAKVNTTQTSSTNPIVIYDGVCNFCNGAVKFIVNRDPAEVFIFTPIQSDFAQQLITQHATDTVGEDTFLLIKNGRAYKWSDAALEITRDLRGLWFLFNVLRLIPQSFRDVIYRAFARNRIRIFGGSTQCQIPDKNTLRRFRGL
jgi:predicted DCC family thiol-disulfide oxidoreductase YuxK